MEERKQSDPWELPRFRNREPEPPQPLGRRLWDGWKRFGMGMAKVNLYIVNFMLYWTVFAIIAIIAKILRRDWLDIRRSEGSYWRELPPPPENKEENYRQF